MIYRVQVGAYSNEGGAKTMQKKLEKAGFSVMIVKGIFEKK